MGVSPPRRLWFPSTEGKYLNGFFRRQGGVLSSRDGGRGAMTAIDMLMEVLRSIREWHIGHPYSKAVC